MILRMLPLVLFYSCHLQHVCSPLFLNRHAAGIHYDVANFRQLFFFQNLNQFADDLSIVRGPQAMKLGANIEHFDIQGNSASRNRGELFPA